jgi:hypothetical protein
MLLAMKTPPVLTRNPRIIAAIRERRLLKFVYHGQERLVEPQTYGLSTTGGEVLRALQISGGSASGPSRLAKLFAVEKISKLRLTDETFAQALPAHNPADSAMTEVFATLPKPARNSRVTRKRLKASPPGRQSGPR